jgi:hypothetical protein
MIVGFESLHHRHQTGSGAQPPIKRLPGALSLGAKRPGLEADHSTPPSAEFKNAWTYTSSPHYAFTALCLVKKYRDNFTFTFTL